MITVKATVARVLLLLVALGYSIVKYDDDVIVIHCDVIRRERKREKDLAKYPLTHHDVITVTTMASFVIMKSSLVIMTSSVLMMTSS